MKKFLSWLGCTICAFVLATVGAVALISCNETGPRFLHPAPSKQVVQLCLDSIVNPTFTSFSDVIECQKTLKSNAFIDSVFLSMSPDIIKNVYSVVSKKIHYVQKSDLVGEWLNNRSIYDNLPPPDDKVANTNQTTTITTEEKTIIPGVVKEGTTTVTEAPPTRVVTNESPGSYHDTIIDGKKALISTH